MKIDEWLAQAKKRLAEASETPALEAQALLAHVLGRPRAWLLAHPEAELQPPQLQNLDGLLARLEKGEPLPYLLGRCEFYGLEFTVSPAVLIPRPETELLVEQALAWLRLYPARRRLADVGTGSGCIAVALAAHAPGLEITATDISEAALVVARQNAIRHGVEARIRFVRCDLLAEAPGPFDLICANLPYIPSRTLNGLAVRRWEPVLALDGGPDGLDLVRRLLPQARQRLAPNGLVLLEIEAGQGAAALALTQAVFPRAVARLLPDLAGRDRLVSLQD